MLWLSHWSASSFPLYLVPTQFQLPTSCSAVFCLGRWSPFVKGNLDFFDYLQTSLVCLYSWKAFALLMQTTRHWLLFFFQEPWKTLPLHLAGFYILLLENQPDVWWGLEDDGWWILSKDLFYSFFWVWDGFIDTTVYHSSIHQCTFGGQFKFTLQKGPCLGRGGLFHDAAASEVPGHL